MKYSKSHKTKFTNQLFLIREGVQQSKQEKDNDDVVNKPKKSQRNYPVYYVNTKQNGKFGKSMRAFTSEEFSEKYGKI